MLTMIGLLVVPLVYILPQIVMTAELACMMPSNSGAQLLIVLCLIRYRRIH